MKGGGIIIDTEQKKIDIKSKSGQSGLKGIKKMLSFCEFRFFYCIFTVMGLS